MARREYTPRKYLRVISLMLLTAAGLLAVDAVAVLASDSNSDTNSYADGFAGRLGVLVGYSSYTNEELSEQLQSYDLTSSFDGSLAIGLDAGVYLKHWLIDLEWVFSGSTKQLFPQQTHTVTLYNHSLNLWVRYVFDGVVIESIALSPGAAAGYGYSEVSMAEDNGDMPPSDTVLEGAGAVYSVGLAVDWTLGSRKEDTTRAWVLSLDYRYNVTDLSDTRAINGGDAFFPDPSIDVSGHTILLGLRFVNW